MFTVPALTPAIRPVPELAVATAALLLLQVPPVSALLRVIVCPPHTTLSPVLLPGVGFTVITFVTVHAPP